MEIFTTDQLGANMGQCQVVDYVAAGDNAVVVIVNMSGKSKPLALKIITNGAGQEDILKETNIQIYASQHDIAPQVFGYTVNIWNYIQNPEDLITYMKTKLANKILRKIFKRGGVPKALQGIVMEIIQPIWVGDDNRDTITPHHQQQLVSKTWRMVQLGIIHNDLHQGNVGILKGNACIYDFGEAEIINVQSVALPPVVTRQLLVSQLYSLLTRAGCNHNNNIDLCGYNQPIHDAIYFVKSHTARDLSLLENMINPPVVNPPVAPVVNPPVAIFNTYKKLVTNNK